MKIRLDHVNQKKIAALAVIACALCVPAQAKDDDLARCVTSLFIQGQDVNLRSEQNTSAPVVAKLNMADYCAFLEKGNEETIGGKKDFWYKVTWMKKTGWVFGAFTSLKQEGRKKMTLVFNRCEGNFLEHVIFKDPQGKEWDFFEAGNNYCKYQFCAAGTDSSGGTCSVGSKQYIGKTFEAVVNNLTICPYDFASTKQYITLPRIIFIRQK